MSCCASKTTCDQPAFDTVRAVNEAYSARALRAGEDVEGSKAIAQAFGYTAEELKAIPDEANMGLSCGNPTAVAKLKEGERVLDLGSGGGIDIFLAAAKVGPTGQAIGLDASTEMLALARQNAAKQGLKPPHVAFVQASLEKELPIESNSIDCIISNCVVNLLPQEGKTSVLKEAYRVLKPGGRIVLDDIVAKKPLPADVKANLAAYVGCIAGAITEEEYRAFMADAGFKDVLFVDQKSDLSVYWKTESNAAQGNWCCSTDTPDLNARPTFPEGFDPNEWAGSHQIYALKPQGDEAVEPSPNALKRWWDAYPAVKSSPESLTAEEVAALVRDPELKGKVAVVDVRRNDHAGGHVKGSEQWPAQTIYDDMPALFEKHKNTERVIFYCQSSNGRGPRSAGWYQDYLDAQEPGSHASKALVLQGGVKEWKAKYTGEEDLVDYDA